MITLIGTTHLMSKEYIEDIIKKEKPDVIGVELCQTRFKIFTNQLQQGNEKDETLLGKIADETKKKAQEENLDYGSDMKTAMFYALNNQIPLELVDKDIIEIRNEMSKIPLEEQLYLQQELLKFQQEKISREINEEEVIEKMRKDIPLTYKILVENRNIHIVGKLKELSKKHKNKKIIVFLGKGHIKDVEKRLGND